MSHRIRRQVQHLANVAERKWPGTIVGCDPATSIEIEFSLDRARRAMEPSQIQPSLFEDSGRQIFPARLELVIVGGVHLILICLLFLPQVFEDRYFRKFRKIAAPRIARMKRMSRSRTAG